MNYLAHHAVARRVRPQGSADFFAGNLLPDLVSMSGDGRIRTAGEQRGDIADGVRLHLATDKAFHTAPAFADTQSIASERILAAPWETPPTRRFFAAHVFVELALDAHLLHESPDLPTDLYTALAASLRGDLVSQAETLLGKPAPNLETSTNRFIEIGFLRDYASPAGLARSLMRVCRRAGIPNFETTADRETLAQLFDDFAPLLAPFVARLLTLPVPAVIQ